MEFPELLINLDKANADEGWSRRVDVAFALYLDYAFGSPGDGWHVGVALDLLSSTVGRDGFAQESSFLSFEVLPRVGYRWFPMKYLTAAMGGDGPRQDIKGLGPFLHPWLGVGPIFALENTPQIGEEAFEESTIQFVGTVHLGWTF